MKTKKMVQLTCKSHNKGWNSWSLEVENDWDLIEKTIGEHMVKCAMLSLGDTLSTYKSICEVQVRG